MDSGAWLGYSPQDRKKSAMTERLSTGLHDLGHSR